MDPEDEIADLGPRLDDTDVVHFTDSRRPAMETGRYGITLSHDLGAFDLGASRSIELVVDGPQFALTGADIAARFPPSGASGDFDRVLPHVALHRATLPWDRRADRADDTTGHFALDDGLPWLALLVLTEDESAAAAGVVAARDLLADVPPGWTAAVAGPGLDHDRPVMVLDLPGADAAAILPTGAELSALCSVRDVRRADGHVLQDGRATVMANRLPPPGTRCTAHLVSVEAHYVHTAKGFVHWSAAAASLPDTVRLVSLSHWSFVATPAHGDLTQKLKAVTPRPLARDGAAPLGFLRRMIHSGGTVLRHNGTTGRVTPRVYHGPLVATVLHDRATIDAKLPARRARDLLLEDPDTGLPDIAYAAAWELGRLLALRDSDVAVPLHDWKGRVTHDARAQVHGDALPELRTQRRPPEAFPLRGWFTRALARLGDVPFAYIVPDPAAVPPESLNFAQVDAGWIAALMDGAFSIGRTDRARVAQDAALIGRGVLPGIAAASAVILRSAVVSGWPDLVFEPFAGADPVATVSHMRLDRDTLILLFAQPIDRLDVHLHPQAIHFGVDRRSPGQVHKMDDTHQVQPFAMRDAVRGVLPIAEMAAALAPGAGSGAFARHMIEGVPKVSFNIWVTV